MAVGSMAKLAAQCRRRRLRTATAGTEIVAMTGTSLT